MEVFHDLFFDYTLRTVTIGAGILGIASGVLGSFIVLKKQSLLGDVMSHAALPGIALAFIITGTKNSLFLLIGAALSGWLATLLIFTVVNNTRIKFDGALAMHLSVFFGLGLVLLTIIQQMPDSSQAGLETFLFGQAAALTQYDIKLMGIIGTVSIFLLVLFWKEFKISTFDPVFAASSGFNVRLIDIFITSLVIFAIVIGLQTVGVVLMSSMVIAPAVAARQWTDRLSRMVILAGFFGAAAGIAGALASSFIPRLPTGPAIVITVSILVFFSLLFSPRHGTIYGFIRRKRNVESLRLEMILEGLYKLALKHKDPYYPHSAGMLRIMYSSYGNIDKSLEKLENRGLVRRNSDGLWALTENGLLTVCDSGGDKRR